MARPQPRHDQSLLRLGGRGLLDDGVDLVQALAPRHMAPANGAVVGQQALSGCLDGRDGAGFCRSDCHQQLGAVLAGAADVEVVADQVQKRVAPHEFPGAVDGVAMATRLCLGDEMEAPHVLPGYLGVGFLVARVDHNRDLFDAGGGHFLHENAQHRLLDPVAIGEGLQWQGALFAPGGGNDGFGDFHAKFPAL